MDLTILATHYNGGEEQALADFASLASVPEPVIGYAVVGLSAAMGMRPRFRCSATPF